MDQTDVVELDSLFDEKTLGEIYWKAPSFFSNRFNTWVFSLTAITLSLFAFFHIWVPDLREKIVVPFADTFGVWANLGASLSGTILGFLIAGFAILCTVLRPQTMIALQKLKSEKYGATELKVLFVLFIDVLVQYLALLLISVIAVIVGGKAGPAALLGKALARIHWMVPYIALHVLFVCWGTWLVMLVLTLKSFVYNLYQTLLLGLADTVDDYQRHRLTVRCELTENNSK